MANTDSAPKVHILRPPGAQRDLHQFVDLLDRWQQGLLPGYLVVASDDINPESVEEQVRQLPISRSTGPRLVLPTSGSTGAAPNLVVLSRGALAASAHATQRALGGPGTWVLPLPLQHIAGIQVVLRSLAAEHMPLVTDTWPRFSPESLGKAASRHDGSAPLYTSLVSPQLASLLQNPQATEECRSFNTILLGGGRIDVDLLAEARGGGLNVTTTYGMTETCGGCVYDGIPLENTRIAIEEGTERVLIASDALMDDYLGSPSFEADTHWVERSGTRYFRTPDVGILDAEGRLHITGRADDIINSGGVKVVLGQVQDTISALPGVDECAVCATNDPIWGETVTALVVQRGQDRDPQSLRDSVVEVLGTPYAPRVIVYADTIPRTDLGKVRTAKVRSIVENAIRSDSAWKR